MDFLKVIDKVCRAMDEAGIHYALIGGFAMALRGVQRATVDLDFIMLLQDLNRADEILRHHGYERTYHSENVSHYRAHESAFGRIDILHAFRTPSLGMLKRAEQIEISKGLSLPVVRAEDIIGLKVQAAVNDPRREDQDWLDIKLLLQVAAEQQLDLDWHLLGEYLTLFGLSDRKRTLRGWYDEAR